MRRVQGCGLLLQTFRAVCVPARQKREPYTKMAEPIEMLFGFWTRAGPHGAQQQTRRTPLLWSNDGTDRQTDGRTDARPLHRPWSAYYADSGSNKVSKNRAVENRLRVSGRTRPLHDALRVRGHEFQLPNCIYKFHKQSFIVSSLFRFLK